MNGWGWVDGDVGYYVEKDGLECCRGRADYPCAYLIGGIR